MPRSLASTQPAPRHHHQQASKRSLMRMKIFVVHSTRISTWVCYFCLQCVSSCLTYLGEGDAVTDSVPAPPVSTPVSAPPVSALPVSAPPRVRSTSPDPDVPSTLLPASDKPLAPCNTEDKPTATEDEPGTAPKKQRPKPKPKAPAVRKSNRNAGKTKTSES